MAVTMIMDFPNATQQQYDSVMKELNLGGQMPAGGILHVAGPATPGADRGWRVVDVWEDETSFQHFFDAKLQKAMQNAGIEPPEVKVFPVHNRI